MSFKLCSRWAFGLALLTLLAPAASAQLMTSDTASGGLTAEDLVDGLLGDESDVFATNISLTGDGRCAGLFTDGGTLFGIDAGVGLSSGQLNDAPGPNDTGSNTTAFGTPGDAFLDVIAGNATFDACILEFDFECEDAEADTVSFQYVFGSEEYDEFVGSQFNDAFAFILNGVNIALLPDGVTPVTINNVNNGTNSAFYNDNTPPFVNVQMDGFTTVLGAEAGLDPGVNNIRLAIADAGDQAWDSWTFVEAGSFQCTPLCEEFDPIAWWRFDENEEEAGPSGSVVIDSSVNDNDGNLWNGASRVPGLIGTAVELDGVNDYVMVGSDPEIDDLQSFTYSAWIYPHAAGNREIFSKNMSTRELRLSGGGNLRGCIIASIANACSDSVETVPLNSWTHVAMTYDHAGDRQVHLYINGVEVTYNSQSTANGAMQSDAFQNQFLGRRQDASRDYDGLFDEMQIFGEALPLCAIEALASVPE